MKKLKKITLEKEVIATLNHDEMNDIKGGGSVDCYLQKFTTGCTDGCTGTFTFATYLNCTKANCTADCGTLVCDTGLTCTWIN